MKTRTYAGIEEKYAKLENSKIVLIPIAYDGTSTWGKGADKGPDAFLEASENMELFDIETKSEVYKNGIYLTETLNNFQSPDQMVEVVHDFTKKYINKNKFVTAFGGEHSISIGTIRAFNECFDNLTVLHIDAHADLRNSYNGSNFNHACALYEASKNTNLVQVGIRSMDISEMKVIDDDKVFYAHEMTDSDDWMESAIDLMSKNVFITFDFDALDPSIFPSTGTPEPGGLLWYETLEFLKMVFSERNVVGFDLVELCPNELEKSSDFLAAKLYYKMLSYKFCDENDAFDDDYEENYRHDEGNFKGSKFLNEEEEDDDF